MSMLRLEQVTVEVAGKRLLDRVDLHVPAGRFAILHGESGAGKSTVLRALIGQLPVTSGRLTVGGEAVTPGHIHRIREQVVYVPQQTAALDQESAREFVLLPFSFRVNRSLQPAETVLAEWLARFHLDRALLAEPVARLSGGERQRLALIRALLLRRPVVLLDEPTSAMDSANRDRVLAALATLEETTVLAVSHDPNLARQAHLTFRLAGGRIVPGGDHGRA